MTNNDPHLLRTAEAVRAIIGEESPGVRTKLFDAIEATARAFIERSPFLLLATADAAGVPDVSPKGDHPGFVRIEDEHTLLVPDRKGNRLILGLQNILENPHLALIFLLPGTDETLRVHGTAELTAAPAVLAQLSARGQPALLAIRVHVDQCFFHCAKAFRRSRLWDHAAWPPPLRVSFGAMLAPRLGGGAELAEKIDRRLEEDYKNNL